MISVMLNCIKKVRGIGTSQHIYLEVGISMSQGNCAFKRHKMTSNTLSLKSNNKFRSNSSCRSVLLRDELNLKMKTRPSLYEPRNEKILG